MACLNTMLRKGATFQWMEQCNNVFKLLRSKLVKMPTLQYPNPNKPFKLFTDASKHSSSGILYQEETPKIPNAGTNLIPIAYLSGLLVEPSNYGIQQSIQKFAFYLTGANCMLYCDHKPSALFFTMGMTSPVLNRWALEL